MCPNRLGNPICYVRNHQVFKCYTLQEANISQHGNCKIIFKYAFSGGYVSSLEGNQNVLHSKLHHVRAANLWKFPWISFWAYFTSWVLDLLWYLDVFCHLKLNDFSRESKFSPIKMYWTSAGIADFPWIFRTCLFQRSCFHVTRIWFVACHF